MLDDIKLIQKIDKSNSLKVVNNQYQQLNKKIDILNAEFDNREIKNLVIIGMGGSGLAAKIISVWLKDQIKKPIEIVQDYQIPSYLDKNSFVLLISCSGNTEEVTSKVQVLKEKDCQLAIISGGGELEKIANKLDIVSVKLDLNDKIQPRMTTLYQLRAIVKLFIHFKFIHNKYYKELESISSWIKEESVQFNENTISNENFAKQLAQYSLGKIGIFYGGEFTWPVAYKWKISWNENAKNIAFWNKYPEFNHNEFIGWTRQPVNKPFVVVDIKSTFEPKRITQRFELSDKLLSGMRPKAVTVDLQGDSLIKQLAWGNILADYTSIYLALLANIDPVPVDLITKLKSSLNDIDVKTQ